MAFKSTAILVSFATLCIAVCVSVDAAATKERCTLKAKRVILADHADFEQESKAETDALENLKLRLKALQAYPASGEWISQVSKVNRNSETEMEPRQDPKAEVPSEMEKRIEILKIQYQRIVEAEAAANVELDDFEKRVKAGLEIVLGRMRARWAEVHSEDGISEEQKEANFAAEKAEMEVYMRLKARAEGQVMQMRAGNASKWRMAKDQLRVLIAAAKKQSAEIEKKEDVEEKAKLKANAERKAKKMRRRKDKADERAEKMANRMASTRAKLEKRLKSMEEKMARANARMEKYVKKLNMRVAKADAKTKKEAKNIEKKIGELNEKAKDEKEELEKKMADVIAKGIKQKLALQKKIAEAEAKSEKTAAEIARKLAKTKADAEMDMKKMAEEKAKKEEEAMKMAKAITDTMEKIKSIEEA